MPLEVETATTELGECSRLLANTRSYILKLEECSLCGRITTCEQTDDGWQCDGAGCRIRLAECVRACFSE